MKNILKSVTTSTFVAILLVSSSAIAHEGGHANAGYIGDMSGHIALDGSGNCLHTSIFNKAKHGLAECGEGPAKKKVAKKNPAPAPAPAQKPVVHENITLGAHALFDSNKADLRPAGIAELNDVAAKLKSYYSLEKISIVGHTDSRGTEAHNQALSERRASAVEVYLTSKGISSNVFRSSGAGETSPTASNKTATGRQSNRRVEINITAKK